MSDDETTIDNLEQKVESARHVDKRQKWILFWLVGAMAFFAVLLLALFLDTRVEADRSAEVAAIEQQEKVEVASEAREAICGDEDQAIYDRELCEKLAGIAEENPGSAVDSPAVVIGGPSQADIIEGFRAYCAEGNCRGPEGAEPTPSDIADAFGRYCTDGRCTGPPGEDGTDAPPASPGTDGEDGTDAPPPSLELMAAAVTQYCSTGVCVGPEGPQGSPPTAEAVSAAVAAYCSTGVCVGAPGADGAPGTTGADGLPGRSLIDVECQQVPDYAWFFTYSDGAVETIPGPCRSTAVLPPPEPQPTSEPPAEPGPTPTTDAP